MRLKEMKGKYYSSFSVSIDNAIDVKELVNNVFARDPYAKISFLAEESAHMGHNSYDVDCKSDISNILSDINEQISFGVRIETKDGLVLCNTNSLDYFKYAPYNEVDIEKAEEILKEIIKKSI
jgi:hypothetical protein